LDSLQRENEKLQKEVEKNMKKAGITRPKEPKPTKNEKKAAKRQRRFEKDTRQFNNALEQEMRRTRRQQAVTGAAVVGAITANTIVDANSNKPAKPDTLTKSDTITVETIKTDTIYVRDTLRPDTIYVRDTIRIGVPTTVAPAKALPTAHVYFAINSAKVGSSYKELLDNAATWMRNNPKKRVTLTGVTDATGSPALNKQLAERRISAIENEMKKRGIDIRRFDKKVEVSKIKTKTSNSANRRVDITVSE
jgi:outer membrane protein OmpA-like peptidoglycan-associated protein